MQALSKAAQGQTYTVKWMFGFSDVLNFLRSYDIQEGSSIKVIGKTIGGLIIGTDTKRLFIGNEAADRIQD